MTVVESQALTIVQALNAVMMDVQAVRKGDRNKEQGFNFRGVDAVVNAAGPAFRAHGIIPAPSVDEHWFESYNSKSGTPMRNTVVKVRYKLWGPDGGFMEVGPFLGEAADSGDKSVTKAQSVAYRVMLLQVLCIPTDEPDPDASVHERANPNEPQLVSPANLHQFMEHAKTVGVDPREAVRRATNDRTSTPEQLFATDLGALKETVDALAAAKVAADAAEKAPAAAGQPPPTDVQLARLAALAFEAAGNAAPARGKTRLIERLRHAATWQVTRGRTESFKQLTDQDRHRLAEVLAAIGKGDVTFEHDEHSVTWISGGKRNRVAWALFEDARADQ